MGRGQPLCCAWAEAYLDELEFTSGDAMIAFMLVECLLGRLAPVSHT